MKKILLVVVRTIVSYIFYIFRVFPVKNNKVIFTNFNGKGFGDSTKYVAEKLHQLDNNLKILWVVSEYYKDMPNYIKQVKVYSIKWIYNLVTSKVWINNSRFSSYVKKRKQQYYIQLWHGGLALKKIEFDVYTTKNKDIHYWNIMMNDNKNIDLMISNSDFCTNMYKNAFKYKGEILELGTPRNDILVNNSNNNIKEKVYKLLNIDNKKKILLYAPTFRSEYINNPYDINFDNILKCLENITGSKWEVIIRLHPNIKKDLKLINYTNIIDVSKYPDMQELILACDMLITDYSSTMFETLIANKPVILYTKDFETYKYDRGYYFNFNELPFPIAKTNQELIDLISNIPLENIIKEYKDFKLKVGLKESGNASIEVAKIIKEKCN